MRTTMWTTYHTHFRRISLASTANPIQSNPANINKKKFGSCVCLFALASASYHTTPSARVYCSIFSYVFCLIYSFTSLASQFLWLVFHVCGLLCYQYSHPHPHRSRCCCYSFHFAELVNQMCRTFDTHVFVHRAHTSVQAPNLSCECDQKSIFFRFFFFVFIFLMTFRNANGFV